jgi:hypothetical protein
MRTDSASTLRQWDAGGEETRVTGFPGARAGCDVWRIIRTGARCEKIVARQCRAAGITHFLPLVRLARQYGGVACRVEVPLFNGYLFAQADEATLRAADPTESIREVADAPQPATGWQLTSLAQALARDVALEPAPGLINGRRVEVVAGALAGMQGLIGDADGADGTAARSLVLPLDALGQAFITPLHGAAVARVSA